MRCAYFDLLFCCRVTQWRVNEVELVAMAKRMFGADFTVIFHDKNRFQTVSFNLI